MLGIGRAALADGVVAGFGDTLALRQCVVRSMVYR
jgi:hypothetical protein